MGYLSKPAFGSWFAVIVAVLLPAIALVALEFALNRISVWLMLPVSVVVLLFAVGRGEFKEMVSEYTKACYIKDWQQALARAERLGVDIEGLVEGDWNTLHQHVLDRAGYRGFERVFAVFFWFFILGPAGALLYRLLAIYCQQRASDARAGRALWLLEWPAVRLLGVSFAFTGNFVGCYNRWRECVFCGKRSTVAALSPLILGALAVEENTAQTGPVTRKELVLLYRLYSRTMWFWLVVAALIILLL